MKGEGEKLEDKIGGWIFIHNQMLKFRINIGLKDEIHVVLITKHSLEAFAL